MSDFTEAYNFARHDLQPDENFIFLFSDGWTRRGLFLVLLLDDEGNFKIKAELRSENNRQTRFEGEMQAEEALLNQIEDIRQDEQHVYHLKPEYHFHCTDTESCLLGFRFQNYLYPVSVKVAFLFVLKELEKQFQNPYEKRFLELLQALLRFQEKLVAQIENLAKNAPFSTLKLQK